MASEDNFIIQIISTKNKRIKFEDGAIFKRKQNKLVGFLNEEKV
jgi:hypothetical protein